MKNSELELWNKIKAFQFDKPNVRLTFARRLAKENGISVISANEVVEEYRKFIFLCCVSQQRVSPSHLVDQAWHLHLTYTRSYWIDLCENTIGKGIHHEPTEGGEEEDKKYKNLYKSTLDLYESYFSKAPENIWPKEPGEPERSSLESEKSRYWMFPLPAFAFRRPINAVIILIIFLGLFLGCTPSEGMVFLIVGLVVIAGVIIYLIRRNFGGRGGSCSSGCGSGCGGIFGSPDNGDSGSDGSSDGGGSSCSSGCSGGCGGGD